MWRVAICMALIVVFALWVSFQMFRIQLIEGDKWLSQSDSLTIIRQDISPARGNIFSDDGSLLATSMPIYEVRWDATVANQDSFNTYLDALAIEMSEMFPDNTASYYRKSFRKARLEKNRYLLIRRNVNYHQQKEMRSWPIFKYGRYKGGFLAELTTRRVRPAGQLAFRTIGYQSKDNLGVGLERSYNDDLGGLKGQRLAQRISGGYKPINDDNLIEPTNGRDIHTTLNIDFQEIAQRSLSAALDLHNANHGCVVVMEVKTGKIKAISNLKNNGEGKLVEQYNYAIGESYEPGSVWKVFSAMAVMEDNLIQPNDTMDVHNGFRDYYGKPMRDSDEGRYKKMTFVDAFARSSNVAFSSVVFDNYAKSPSKYIGHLKKLGLDKRTGIEILGEPEPKLNHPESASWSRLTLPWLGIGYENQHTPLQLLVAYNGVINDGKMLRPQIVEKVTDAGIVIRNIDEENDPIQVCSKETSDKIKKLTAAVVHHGSGSNIKSSIVELAGKTGTAQIASSSGYQTTKMYNASFVGHFPAENPVYSVFVMVNKPSNGQFYASSVAAPIFKEIAEKIYTISVKQDVNPSEKRQMPTYTSGYYSDFKTLNTALGVSVKGEVTADLVQINATNGTTKPISKGGNKVPNAMGLGAKDALYLLEQKGLKVRMTGYGRVVEQSPKPGTSLSGTSIIYIRLN